MVPAAQAAAKEVQATPRTERKPRRVTADQIAVRHAPRPVRHLPWLQIELLVPDEEAVSPGLLARADDLDAGAEDARLDADAHVVDLAALEDDRVLDLAPVNARVGADLDQNVVDHRAPPSAAAL